MESKKNILEVGRLVGFAGFEPLCQVVYPAKSNVFKKKPDGRRPTGKGDGGNPMDYGPLE